MKFMVNGGICVVVMDNRLIDLYPNNYLLL